MGQIIVEVPQDTTRLFRVADNQVAAELVERLHEIAVEISVKEIEKSVAAPLRQTWRTPVVELPTDSFDQSDDEVLGI